MIFQRNIIFLLITSILFLSSCLAPKKRNKNDMQSNYLNYSAINSALNFLSEIENKNPNLNDLYNQLTSETKSKYDFFDFKITMKKYKINNKFQLSAWDKFDISENNTLIYILKKREQKFEIVKIKLIQENDTWLIDLPNLKEFNGFEVITSGDLSTDNILKIQSQIKLDMEKYIPQNKLKQINKNIEISIVDQCVFEGEKLYDKEEYRKALIQFQKALSIDSKCEKAKIYLNRCQKAISLGLGS